MARPVPQRPRKSDRDLSLDSIVGGKKDFNLQKVDPFFTDSNGEYYRHFEQQLEKLNGSNSESQLHYVPPTGLKKWMQVKIGDWPVYTIFLALGQSIAANSYQITLLTGEVGQTVEKLYRITTTHDITSACWWLVILCIIFFGIVWCAFLYLVSQFSKQHSCFLPVFACGLGAPRFIQIWWGVSGISYFLPWVAGGYTGDSIQGLGFGIILLQTLTRMHMCFTLIVSQIIGFIATICARAFAPNSIGPGPVSPDVTQGVDAVANAWFWAALFCQLLVCAGFLLFFRKEQLSKP
ncbi:hypothetical protein BDV12DRAFT_205194 [Aspergillus spectabilis]